MADDKAITGIGYELVPGSKQAVEAFNRDGKSLQATDAAVGKSTEDRAAKVENASRREGAAHKALSKVTEEQAASQKAAAAALDDVIAKTVNRPVQDAAKTDRFLASMARAADPLSAALRKAQGEVSRLSGIIAAGIDDEEKAAQATNSLAAAKLRLADAQRSANVAAASGEQSVGAQNALTKSIRDYRDQLEPTLPIQRALYENIARINAAASVPGGISQTQRIDLIKAATDEYTKQIRIVTGVAAAQDELAASVLKFRDQLNPTLPLLRAYHDELARIDAAATAVGGITLPEADALRTQAKTRFDSRVADVDGTARAAKSAAEAEEHLATVQRALAATTLNLTETFDPATTSALRMTAELANLNKAQQLGINIAGGYTAEWDRIVAKYDEGAAAAKRASDAQSVLIQQARSEQFTANAQQAFNEKLGVNTNSGAGTAAASAAVFTEDLRLSDAAQKLRDKLDPTLPVLRAFEAELDHVTELFDAYKISGLEAANMNVKLTETYDKLLKNVSGMDAVQKIRDQINPTLPVLRAYRDELIKIAEAQKIGGLAPGEATAAVKKVTDTFSTQVRRVTGQDEIDRKSAEAQEKLAASIQKVRDQINPSLPIQRAYYENLKRINELSAVPGGLSPTQRTDAIKAASDEYSKQIKIVTGVAAKEKEAADEAAKFDIKVKSLLADIDPLGEATKKYQQALTFANNAASAGKITDEQRIAAHALAARTLDKETEALKYHSAATGRGTVSAQQMHFALQNLTFQVNDVVTSIASGISPMRTLAQQGGQFVQVFQQTGGVSAAFTAIGTGIASLFTPMKILGAGLIAAGAGFALLTVRASSATTSVREFDVLLKGLGDSNLASGSGLEAAAKRLRDVGLSASDARDKLKEVTRAGLNPENAERVVRTGENLKPVLGDKAGSELTSALSGGLEETIKFGLQLDVFKAKQIETWREMARGAQGSQALNQAFAAIEARAKGLSREALSPTAQSLRDLGVRWSNLLDKMTETGPVHGLVAALDDLAAVLERISKVATSEWSTAIAGALAGAAGGAVVAGPAGAVVGAAVGGTGGLYYGARTATGEPVATASIPAVTHGTANTAASAAAADAESMLGLKEGRDATRIREFLGWSDNMSPDQIAWCAAFANAALARHGISGTGSNVANSFLNWGTTVSGTPQAGDVLVQSRGLGANQTGGHVGLATGNVQTTASGGTQYEMISGNSGATTDAVTKAWINANEVVVKRAVEAANSTVTNATDQLDMNALVQSVVEVESGGIANKVSPKGAQGLMQLMPATAAQYGVTEPLNGVQNVAGGTQYLKDLLAHYNGDVELALMAYNWGEGNLDNALKAHEAIPDTVRNYSKTVIEGAGGLSAIGASSGTIGASNTSAGTSASVNQTTDIRRQRPEGAAAEVTKLIKEEERQILVLNAVGAASDVVRAKQEAATIADEKALPPEQARRLEIAKIANVYERVTAANSNAITATSLESLNLREVAKAYNQSAAAGMVAENQAKATTEAYQQYGEIQSESAKKLISSRSSQFTILEQNQFKETIAKQSAADRDQIENIRLEISLQGKTTEEITRQVNLQKAVQEAENKGLDLSDQDVQNRLKVVDAIDRQKEALAEAQRAQERLNSLVTSLVDTITNELTVSIEKAFSGEKVDSWGKRINSVLGSLSSTISSSLFLKPLAGTALSAVGATGLAQSFGTFDNLFGSSASSTSGGSSSGVSVEKSSDGSVLIKGLDSTTSLTNSLFGTSSGGIFGNLFGGSNSATTGATVASNDNIYGALSGAGSKSLFNNTDSFLGTLSGSSSTGAVGSSLSSAGSSLFSLATLKGVGAGFGAGTLLNSLIGGNKTTGTVGSGVGALAGAGLGSLFPVVGTTVGGIAGGLLGSLGGLFGGTSKPNNATGASIDLSTGTASSFTSAGSATNDKTLKEVRDALTKFTTSLQSSTGGTTSGYINPQATDKGLKLDYNITGFGSGVYNTQDSQDAIDVAEQAIVKGLSGVSSLTQMVIDKYSGNIDDLKTALDAASAYKDTTVTDTVSTVINKTSDPAKLADSLKFAKTYDKISEAATDAFASIPADLKIKGTFEKAHDDIKTTFDDIADTAKGFDLAIGPINAARDEANKRLTDDFNRSTKDLITAAEDPLQSLVDIEKRAGDARVKEAESVAGDIEAINKLNAKNLDKIWTDATKNIQDLRDEFKTGDLSGLTDYQRLPAARTKYVDTLAAVQGGDTSKWDTLITDAKNLFTLSKSAYGEGPKTAEWRTAITAVLDNVLAGRTFAGGTQSTPSGTLLVGEKGAELISQPGALGAPVAGRAFAEGTLAVPVERASNRWSGAWMESSPSTVRAFAAGTKSTPPGTVLVGERGPELISQPGGLHVYTHHETQKILASLPETHGYAVSQEDRHTKKPNIISLAVAKEGVAGTRSFAAGVQSTPAGTILVGEMGPELISQPGALRAHVPPMAAGAAALMSAVSSNVVSLPMTRGFWQGTAGQYATMMPEVSGNVVSMSNIMGFADGTSEQNSGLIAPPEFTSSVSRGTEASSNGNSEEIKSLLKEVVAAVNVNNNISRRGHYETGQELRTQTTEMRKPAPYEPTRRRVAS